MHGEYALGALKDLFGFPGRSGHIGGHGPAQGAHPSAGAALGVPNANLPVGWSLSTTPSPKPHVPQSAGVRAGCTRTVWVSLTSGQGVSNLYQGGWKARIAFWRPSPNLVPQYSVAGGATPAWAPRRGRRSPDIHSGLVEAAFVRIWARSRAVPTGLLEGWYPANTEGPLSRTRAPGVLVESGRAA